MSTFGRSEQYGNVHVISNDVVAVDRVAKIWSAH
jgi:hypothetical protein